MPDSYIKKNFLFCFLCKFYIFDCLSFHKNVLKTNQNSKHLKNRKKTHKNHFLIILSSSFSIFLSSQDFLDEQFLYILYNLFQ